MEEAPGQVFSSLGSSEGVKKRDSPSTREGTRGVWGRGKGPEGYGDEGGYSRRVGTRGTYCQTTVKTEVVVGQSRRVEAQRSGVGF